MLFEGKISFGSFLLEFLVCGILGVIFSVLSVGYVWRLIRLEHHEDLENQRRPLLGGSLDSNHPNCLAYTPIYQQTTAHHIPCDYSGITGASKNPDGRQALVPSPPSTSHQAETAADFAELKPILRHVQSNLLASSVRLNNACQLVFTDLSTSVKPATIGNPFQISLQDLQQCLEEANQLSVLQLIFEKASQLPALQVIVEIYIAPLV